LETSSLTIYWPDLVIGDCRLKAGAAVEPDEHVALAAPGSMRQAGRSDSRTPPVH
jgi:hypothetical protein